VPPVPKTLVVQTATVVNAHGSTVRIAPGPTNERLRLALEIYEDAGYPRHYGAGLFELAPHQLIVDLATRQVTADGKVLPFQWEPRHAGRYWAALWVYQGQTLLQRLPLFRFTDDGKTVSGLERLPTNAAFVALPVPATAQNGHFGAATAITGTTWLGAAPGKRAQLSVWWRALGPTPPLLVTAQLLDAADHKWAQWDGVLGGDATPSGSWTSDQVIRQDIPLQLDPHTPPGHYRLLIRVYHPENGTPVPFSLTNDSPSSGDLVLSEVINNK
nr:hypothetical protein [Herpetosiphonaceae bacterium]